MADEPGDEFRGMLERAGITPEKPLYPILMSIRDSAKRVEATAKLNADDLDRTLARAARASFDKAGAAAVQTWVWKRHVGMATALASTVLAAGLLGGAADRILATREAAQWTDWCSDAAHQQVFPDGVFCKVPIIERKGK